MYQHRRGFTVMELLIFSGIFVIVTLTFVSILVGVTRVQVKQGSATEVAQQSQFLMQTIQRYVESSSLVEMTPDTPSSTLTLRMASSSLDPLTIYASSGVIYLKRTTSGTPEPLTSGRVVVNDLTFTKRSHSNGGKDSVAVQLTLSYNSSNPQRQFTQLINTAVTRVNAATFDSNVIPSANNTYKIGASSQVWQSINDVVYFNGTNVGIGVASPGQVLEVNGGARLNTTTGKPTCDSSQRGTFWVTQSGAGTKDAVEVCVRNASSTYLWSVIY